VIPKRFEPLLAGLLLSGLMSLAVSAIATVRALPPGPGLWSRFVGLWPGAWLTAWLVAFPLVLLAAPLVRRVVRRLVDPA
jgi:hypothetical protein